MYFIKLLRTLLLTKPTLTKPAYEEHSKCTIQVFLFTENECRFRSQQCFLYGFKEDINKRQANNKVTLRFSPRNFLIVLRSLKKFLN